MAGLDEDMAKAGRRRKLCSLEDTNNDAHEVLNLNNGLNFQPHQDNKMDSKVLLHVDEPNAVSACDM